MSGAWIHPQCEACWIRHETLTQPDGLPAVRTPRRFVNDAVRVCCWCGHLTISGIYRHVSPVFLAGCTGDHETVFVEENAS